MQREIAAGQIIASAGVHFTLCSILAKKKKHAVSRSSRNYTLGERWRACADFFLRCVYRYRVANYAGVQGGSERCIRAICLF